MPAWLNQVTIAAPRNGTTTHTVDPASGTVAAGSLFTPTAGTFLLAVAEGAVTSTTPSGWTLPTNGSAINNTGLYVWYKASAAGGDTLSTTHNGSNYAVAFSFFEFPASTTFVKAATAVGATLTAANPTISSLTGSNTVMGAAAQGGGNVTAATWSSPNTEIVDTDVVGGVTDGYWLGVAYQDSYVSATYAPTPTITSGGGASTERLTFAVNVPSGTNATVTAAPAQGTGDTPNPTVTAGSTVTSSVVDGTGTVSVPSASAGATVTAPPAAGTGDTPNPGISAGANVVGSPASGVGDAPSPSIGTTVPVLTFDYDSSHYAAFSWSDIDFTGPFSLCFITQHQDPFPGGDKRILELWDYDNEAVVWEWEQSGGNDMEFAASVFTGMDGGTSGLFESTSGHPFIPFGKTGEIWFTWDGVPDFSGDYAGDWHWRNLTDDPTTWYHSPGFGVFAHALLSLVANGALFVGGNPEVETAPFKGGIGFVGGWNADLYDGGAGHLGTDPMHTKVSELQAIDPSSMRWGAQLTSDVPGDVVDLAGAGVVCTDITASLGVMIPASEFEFDGVAPTDADATVTALPADGVGDAPPPALSASAGTADFSTYPNGSLGDLWRPWTDSFPTIASGKAISGAALKDATTPAVMDGADSFTELFLEAPMTSGTGQNFGVGARITAHGPSADQYSFEIASAAGFFPKLYKDSGFSLVASGATRPGTDSIDGIRIVVTGSTTTTIRGYGRISGVWTELVTYDDSSTPFTAAGYGGFWLIKPTSGGDLGITHVSWGQVGAVDATVTGVSAAGTGDTPNPTIGAGSAPISPVADGTGLCPVPSLSAGVVVTAIATVATGDTPNPPASAGSTVVAIVADGTGVIPAPSVTAGGSATVIAVVADGAGVSPAPSVSVGSTLTATVASGVGDIPNPLIDSGSAITAPAAVGVADTPNPTVSAGVTVTVSALVAQGSCPVPFILAGGGVTITAPPASGTGQSPAASIPVTVVAPNAFGLGNSPVPQPLASAVIAAVIAAGTGHAPPSLSSIDVVYVHNSSGAPTGRITASPAGRVTAAPSGRITA